MDSTYQLLTPSHPSLPSLLRYTFYSIFLHYQFTFYTSNEDFFCKLVVNGADVGSLVHTSKQEHKSPTGLWMTNLNAGLYTIEIHYKSPVAINTPATWDWQGAVLQVMWFKDARAVSDGMNCYPVSTPFNNYNNWGPIRDLEIILQLPNHRAILATYNYPQKCFLLVTLLLV